MASNSTTPTQQVDQDPHHDENEEEEGVVKNVAGRVVVVDCGGQYAHLIRTRVRHLGFNSVIVQASEGLFDELAGKGLLQVKAFIISGGGSSVYDKEAPQLPVKLLQFLSQNQIPTLGICFGAQWIAHAISSLSAKAAGNEGFCRVGKSEHGYEFGSTLLTVDNTSSLLEPLKKFEEEKKARAEAHHKKLVEQHIEEDPHHHEEEGRIKVWMSHRDIVLFNEKWDQSRDDPNREFDYEILAHTLTTPVAVFGHRTKPIFGIQYHCEVTHCDAGDLLLSKFLTYQNPNNPTDNSRKWSIDIFYERIKRSIIKSLARENGEKKVFILVSGGVDSTVAFVLLNQILGKDRVRGLLIDNGLMRKNEITQIKATLAASNHSIENLTVYDASQIFLSKLANVSDPEQKRKIVGECFLLVKDQVGSDLGLNKDDWFLGQGTIYPDTIESGSTKHSSKIKTHHNRIDAITELLKAGKLVEPLRDLYKDEVRELGRTKLNIPDNIIYRHPFPGPSFSVRVLCSDEHPSLPAKHRELEASIQQTINQMQAETPGSSKLKIEVRILPIRSVGVQGDSRSYQHCLVLFLDDGSSNNSTTALSPAAIREISRAKSIIWKISSKIPNKVDEINRVVLCVSHSKPPSNDLSHVPHRYLTPDRLNVLREADDIVTRVIEEEGLYRAIWQFPVALVPVGSKPDKEGNETAPVQESIVLRPVDSTEAMTASVHPLPVASLTKLLDRFWANEIVKANIHFVFYDLTSKPPGTIEWE